MQYYRRVLSDIQIQMLILTEGIWAHYSNADPCTIVTKNIYIRHPWIEPLFDSAVGLIMATAAKEKETLFAMSNFGPIQFWPYPLYIH